MGKKIISLFAKMLDRLIGPGMRNESITDLTKASKVGKSTLARARKAEAATRINTLEDIAKPYGLEAWSLVSDVDPDQPPALMTKEVELRSWPLDGSIEYDRIARLDESQLELISKVLDPILKQYEAGARSPATPKGRRPKDAV
ncbi:hypothetical protein [Pollutimonas bauzanensis]|uniref:Uncharacterized protein n=1 Tax=Pollutimonas bauzanensis TaxID=658167 RepID=A0A1M5MTH8_9BURK|nr:hypothetical protein [Pollutimonas bauzanensis]SHG80674.1 hypothetical protein SAMN04488135_101320 [Pollutimonas bauzanensis]